jgi:biotin operon repressor
MNTVQELIQLSCSNSFRKNGSQISTECNKFRKMTKKTSLINLVDLAGS